MSANLSRRLGKLASQGHIFFLILDRPGNTGVQLLWIIVLSLLVWIDNELFLGQLDWRDILAKRAIEQFGRGTDLHDCLTRCALDNNGIPLGNGVVSLACSLDTEILASHLKGLILYHMLVTVGVV